MGRKKGQPKGLVGPKLLGLKHEAGAVGLMLIGQAEGPPRALAARDYNGIRGRPALKADAMLARFQQEGGVVNWVEYTDTKVSGEFSHPKSSPKPVTITWTIDMAKRIGIANKDNWRNYPRAMLRSRCVSEGVRTVYPGIAVGIYTVEEVQDFAKEKDITPTSGAVESLSEDQRVKITDLADKVREWMNQGSLTDAWMEIENSGATGDEDEYKFLWTHFDSRIRRQLKEEGERQKIKVREIESRVISDAQKKRLEARIGEVGADRDEVKAYVLKAFGKEHFADMNASEYNALDKLLDKKAEAQSQPEQTI